MSVTLKAEWTGPTLNAVRLALVHPPYRDLRNALTATGCAAPDGETITVMLELTATQLDRLEAALLASAPRGTAYHGDLMRRAYADIRAYRAHAAEADADNRCPGCANTYPAHRIYCEFDDGE